MKQVSEDEFGRGVWKARYKKDGHEILLAVNSRLDCIKAVVLRPWVDEEAATLYLEGLLDDMDPPPRLTLVREPSARSPLSPSSLAGLMRVTRRASASLPLRSTL